jgi:hypothetical protein
MKIRALFIAASSVIALSSIAMADDHLFQAQQQGLNGNTHSQGSANGGPAPGQASPFTGEETKTPATDTDAANDNANVKPRVP